MAQADSERTDGGRYSIEGAAIAGLLFAALYAVVQVIVIRAPSLLGSSEEIISWYSFSGNRASLLVAFNLAAFASIAFLWFVAVLRRRIGEREDQFLATVFLSSGILFVALMLVGLGVHVAIPVVLGVTDTVPDAADIGIVGGTSNLILVVAMPRMQALFVASTSTIGRKTGALPGWLTWIGYLFALVLLVVPLLFEVPGLGFGFWVGLASATIVVRRRRMELPA
jgi:hypothetical protein